MGTLRVLQRAVASGTDDECEEVLVFALVEDQIDHVRQGLHPDGSRLQHDIKAVIDLDDDLANKICSLVDKRFNEWDLWETHKAESQ